MFSPKKTLRVCICIALFWNTKIFSQESQPITIPHVEIPFKISLEEAKAIAFQNNWDLIAVKSDVDRAIAQKIIAKQLPNPTINYSTQKINIDERPTATAAGDGLWARNYDTIIAINQLFEIAGKRSNRQKSAQSGYEGADAQLNDSKRLLNLGVTKAYCDALLGQKKVKILKNSTISLKKEAELAQIRFKTGEISEADKNQIEISAKRFELDTETAQANEKSLKVTLEVLLGSPKPEGKIQLTDSFDTLWEKNRLPEFNENWVDKRPDLIAAQANLKKAKTEVRLQKALRVPDPTFLFQYEHNPPDQPQTIGLGVSFPFPLLNQNQGEIKSALANEWHAHTILQKLKAQITSEIVTAKTNYYEASSRLKYYETEVRPKSAKVLDSYSYAYKKGGVSLIDYLFIQRNDNEIQIATAEAAADAIIASANLTAVLNLNPDQNLSTQNLKELESQRNN